MSSKRNEEEEKFWRKARPIKRGTWFTYEGRDYYKDNTGQVFEKRGPLMVDLQDPKRKGTRSPSGPVRIRSRPVLLSSRRENRLFSGKHDRNAIMFSEKKRTETSEVILAKEPAVSRSRRRKR